LRLDVPDEDALQEAGYGKDGALQEISFAWLKRETGKTLPGTTRLWAIWKSGKISYD